MSDVRSDRIALDLLAIILRDLRSSLDSLGSSHHQLTLTEYKQPILNGLIKY